MAVLARLVSRYRFSLLTLLALVTLAAAPFLNPSLSTGLFDLQPADIFYSTALAVVTAWSSAITMRLVQLYGPIRFDGNAEASIKPLSLWRLLLGLIPAALIIAQIVYISTSQSHLPLMTALGYAVAGIGWALILVYAALFVYAFLAPSESHEHFPDVVLPPQFILPPVKNLARRAVPAVFRSCSTRFGRHLKDHPGYADGDGCLFTGHLLAITFTFVLLLLSARFGWVLLWSTAPKYPSALFSSLFLLLFLLWLFSGISFFLDYWRVPILTCFILGGLGLWLVPVPPQWRPAGYEFETWRVASNQKPLSPEDIVRGAPRVIVVAAEGGGIQAAAWTAEILTHLSAIEGFDASVKAISSVSGGSVGAMHYLTRGNSRKPANLRARTSLLNAVGWSLVFRDSRRLRYPGLHHLLTAIESRLWPVNNLPDRGIALERQLAGFLTAEDTFDIWRERARQGRMPAVFFNTTMVSSGRPYPFSNVDLPPLRAVETFQSHFHHDAAIASAVRLSAAFPLVSPAASPSSPELSALAFVDGGYFDNSGVHSALAFLSAALPELDRSKTRVLLIRIKSFPPDPVSAGAAHPGLWQSPEWLQQFAAPLSTMLSTRTSGQDNSTARALELTALAYSSAIEFSWIDARFPALAGVDPAMVPLNWHLTKVQQEWIDRAWAKAGPEIERQVSAFLER
jgi:hypothetical protein